MVDKDVVRRGYEKLGTSYAADRSAEGPGMAALSRLLTSLTPEDRVLDVGCGPGTPVLAQLSESATAFGLDFSREQLALATENAPGATLVCGDMTRLPVRDNTFDALTVYHSLIHVPLADHQAVIDEFARVLRPDGQLLLSEGPEEWTGTNPDWLESGIEMQWNIAGAPATRDQLRNAGFELVEEWGTDSSDDESWLFFLAQLDT